MSETDYFVGKKMYNTYSPHVIYTGTHVTGDCDNEIIHMVREDGTKHSTAVDGFHNRGWRIQEAAEKKQVGGDHYTMHKIQPWDIIDAYGLDFYEGNALKYLLRYKDKNGIEDLEKAIHYIERIIEGMKRNA